MHFAPAVARIPTQQVDAAVVASKDDHGIPVHLDREVVAGLRDLARMSGEEPAAPPDPLDVEAPEFHVDFMGQDG